MFWGNWLAALLLLLSLVIPELPPIDYPTLSLFSLIVPIVIAVNILFVLFWLVFRKRNIWLSLLVLIISYFQFGPFVEFNSSEDASEYRETLSVLSYNVHLFNAYEKVPDTVQVSEVITQILKEEDPDVVSIQEYYNPNNANFSAYPFSYIHFRRGHKLGHAIFSKYPIARHGAFNFQGTFNNSIYADIVKGKDTIRVYNLHLQSMGILPNVEYLQDGDTEQLKQRMTTAFKKQQTQIQGILAHKKRSPYPVIFSGDLNNTPYSYIYNELREDMKDAFSERGSGIGRTFSFEFYPMRIDYILTSENLEVLDFSTLNNTFSDHKPIRATVGWPVKAEAD